MAKRHIKWGERTYRRFLKEGRGQGELAAYNPWIHTHDFPSRGKVTRILGRVTGRIHHLMSQHELDCFLYLEELPGIEDIKEQYPLPLYKTQLAAARLNIRHPEVNGFPWVMTTDFVYRRNGRWHAVQVKTSSELEEPRVQEKFSIEKACWEDSGISWRVMTEKDLSAAHSYNVLWLRSGAGLETLIPDPAEREAVMQGFLELYQDGTIDFHILLEEVDKVQEYVPGTAMQIFKALVMRGQIALDLSRPLNLSDPRQLPYLSV